MQYICKKMKEKDDTFPEHVKGLLRKVSTRALKTDTFKAIATELQSKVGKAKSNLDQVVNSGEDHDNFMDLASAEIQKCEEKANAVQKQKEELLARHTKCVVFYGLKPDEELAKDSELYLKGFIAFFKNAVECMPPEEKKRGGGRPAGASSASAGGAAGGMMAHMAEI